MKPFKVVCISNDKEGWVNPGTHQPLINTVAPKGGVIYTVINEEKQKAGIYYEIPGYAGLWNSKGFVRINDSAGDFKETSFKRIKKLNPTTSDN